MVTGVAAGTATITYTVTENGCATSVTRTVTVNALPTVAALTGTQTVCAGATTTFASTTADGTYSSSNTSIATVNASTGVITGVAAGTATITYEVTQNGCATSVTRTVTVNALPSTPTISAGGATSFCTGSSVVLTSSANSGNQWYKDGGAISGATGKTYTATAAGDYTVTTTDGNSCTSNPSSTITVTINPIPTQPVITPGGVTTFCPGGLVILISSTNSGNQWYKDGVSIPGATGTTYTATASGNYSLIVTIGGCPSPVSSSVNVVVISPATPTVNAAGPTSFCQGGSVTLTSSAASGNQWYVNGVAIAGANDQVYTATSSGNYTVMSTVNGCSSANSAAVAVTANPLPSTPTISAGGSATFCVGGSIVLTSSANSGNQWYKNGVVISGASSKTYTAFTAGTYTVTTTDANGCTSNESAETLVTVNPLPPTPSITASGATTFCSGGSVILTSDAASGNQWYKDGVAITGAINATYTATVGGSYTVSTTNNNGCASAVSSPISVTVSPSPAAPSINVGGATTFCAGGAVTLTSGSNTGNQWYKDGIALADATNSSYTATAGGSYTVTVTNSHGCTSGASASVVVTVNTLPSAPSINMNGATIFCEGGSLILTSNNNSGNQWYKDGIAITGATNASYTATVAGSYTVRTTNSNGCTSNASASVEVNVTALPNAPAITAAGPTSFCVGGSVILTSSAATGNQWFKDGIAIPGATTATYTATTQGVYTVTATNNSGCTSVASAATTVTVNSNPATPTITAGGVTTFCEGGLVILISSSASGNQWYVDGSPIPGANGGTLTALTSGTYTVIASVNGCSSSQSAGVTVTVNPIPSTPTISASGPTTICAGESVVLTSSSATGNQWYQNGNLIPSSTGSTYTATTSGTYTVIVTQNGCSSLPSAGITVTVNAVPASPTISTNAATSFCAGGNVTLSATPGTAYQWYNNGNAMSGGITQNWTASNSGTFTVAVQNNGCWSSPSASTVVTVNPLPTAPTATVTQPTCSVSTGTITVSSSTSGLLFSIDGMNYGSGIFNNIAPSTYNLTAKDAATGCISSATTVVVNGAPSAPATPAIAAGGPLTFCSGNSVVLTCVYPLSTLTQWYKDGVAIPGEINMTYTATSAGSYTVELITNGCASPISAPIVITVNPIPNTPIINASGPLTICGNGNVALTSSASSGNQWYLNGNILNGETGSTYTATASGNYTVITTANGCTSSASAAIVVAINPLPATPTVTTSGSTTFCAGGNVILTSSAASGNQWYRDGILLNGVTAPTYTATTSGVYTVVVTSGGCTSSASAGTTVTVNAAPAIPVITANGPTSFCQDQSVLLQTTYVAGYTYQWYKNGVAEAGATKDTLRVKTEGFFTVRVTNAVGCSSQVSAPTQTKITCHNPIFVPDVFTSNGDGVNDVIKPIAPGIVKLRCFKVFNRWGNLIFETTDLNKGWDGKYKGAIQPADTYLWLVEGTDANGTLIKKTGMLTLVR